MRWSPESQKTLGEAWKLSLGGVGSSARAGAAPGASTAAAASARAARRAPLGTGGRLRRGAAARSAAGPSRRLEGRGERARRREQHVHLPLLYARRERGDAQLGIREPLARREVERLLVLRAGHLR